MNFPSVAKAPKGQRKCNLCRKGCNAKDGDWFRSPGSDTQQIFLCKQCEVTSKGAEPYQRAVALRLSR